MPIIAGGHVARLACRSLHVFHQTQFPKRVGADVAVGTDPKRPPAMQCGRETENAVTKIGFRTRANADDGADLASRQFRRRRYVSRGSGTSSATGALSSSQATGGVPSARWQSSTSRRCSATWICIGAAATVVQGPRLQQRCGRTARRLCGARPKTRSAPPPMPSGSMASARPTRCIGNGF